MALLEQFLKTGALGPIYGGMRYAEVVAALGPYPDESPRRKTRIVRYGPLQVMFCRGEDWVDRVTMIAVYPRDFGEELPTAVRFDTTPLTSRERVLAFLSEIGVIPSERATEPAELVRLPSGVELVFDEDLVHGVYAATRTLAPSTRQLTLTLSHETMATLKAMAKAQKKRSVAALAVSLLTAEAERHIIAPSTSSP